MIAYRTYGLTLESNEPIAGLVPIDATTIDCVIRFGELPQIIDAYCFAYHDKTRFVVARDGSAIWCTWETTAEDAATYLLGPILAFVVRLHGALALHASAVLVDDRAIVFAAPPGGGKSTLAAAFARRGHAVLADDVVRLAFGRRTYSPPVSEAADDESAVPCVLAIPGYPIVRLWDDVAAELFGAADALPLLTPTWTKRYLDLRDHGFHNQTAEVAAIYILGERGEFSITPLSGAAAAIALIANSSMNLTLDNELRARELDLVARAVELVPVRDLHVPDSLQSVESACDHIRAVQTGVHSMCPP